MVVKSKQYSVGAKSMEIIENHPTLKTRKLGKGSQIGGLAEAGMCRDRPTN